MSNDRNQELNALREKATGLGINLNTKVMQQAEKQAMAAAQSRYNDALAANPLALEFKRQSEKAYIWFARVSTWFVQIVLVIGVAVSLIAVFAGEGVAIYDGLRHIDPNFSGIYAPVIILAYGIVAFLYQMAVRDFGYERHKAFSIVTVIQSFMYVTGLIWFRERKMPEREVVVTPAKSIIQTKQVFRIGITMLVIYGRLRPIFSETDYLGLSIGEQFGKLLGEDALTLGAVLAGVALTFLMISFVDTAVFLLHHMFVVSTGGVNLTNSDGPNRFLALPDFEQFTAESQMEMLQTAIARRVQELEQKQLQSMPTELSGLPMPLIDLQISSNDSRQEQPLDPLNQS